MGVMAFFMLALLAYDPKSPWISGGRICVVDMFAIDCSVGQQIASIFANAPIIDIGCRDWAGTIELGPL